MPPTGALAHYEELGVTRCIVGLNAEKRDEILPVLDRWVGFMRGFKKVRRNRWILKPRLGKMRKPRRLRPSM
jgi:hypothetical protein